MLDQSYDAFGGAFQDATGSGNGWGNTNAGDASFAATQAPPKGNDYDRLPIPVTVAALNALPRDAEKVEYGTFSFSTIRVIAEVVGATPLPEGTEVRYKIRDRDFDDQEPYEVVHYLSVDGSNVTPFIEGSCVQVVGKIRTFDGGAYIAAFRVVDAEPEAVDIFRKECRLAELYFTKNMPERLATGDMSPFINTMLSTEAPPSNNRAPGGAGNTPGRFVAPQQAVTPYAQQPADDMNGSSVYQSSQQVGTRGSNPQQKAILNYLYSLQNVEDGAHVNVIRTAIKGNSNFDDDILKLANNGDIFSTIDENHYAPITS